VKNFIKKILSLFFESQSFILNSTCHNLGSVKPTTDEHCCTHKSYLLNVVICCNLFSTSTKKFLIGWNCRVSTRRSLHQNLQPKMVLQNVWIALLWSIYTLCWLVLASHFFFGLKQFSTNFTWRTFALPMYFMITSHLMKLFRTTNPMSQIWRSLVPKFGF